jgi:hypothetical protein
MSWNFAHHSKDKEALKSAVVKSFDDSVRWSDNREKILLALLPIKSLVLAAIDLAVLDKSAYCLKVETSGHVDDNQAYFGVTIVPIYIPALVGISTKSGDSSGS